MSLNLIYWLIAGLWIRIAAGCNPLTTSNCPAIPGLASSTYSIDFTKDKKLPPDWFIADGSDVTFGNDGAQFNFRKRKDAGNLITNFYIAFGKIDIVMKAASGTGVISSAVLYSDDLDEIDWEFSGSNFGTGTNNGKVQTNVFGKGITGNYDRGSQPAVSPPPQQTFHTYTINWTPSVIEWSVDGKLVKSTSSNGLNTGNYQHPQTPSRLHLGLWDAGDPDTQPGTRDWAGGLTDFSKVPYTFFVKSVSITTPNPCKSWKYPNNFSGKWSDVKCTNEDIVKPSATTSASTPKSTEPTYTVAAGDNGYTIAVNLGCTMEQLKAANPNVSWDFLVAGQKLNNPNGKAVSSSSSSSSTSQSSTTSSSLTSSSSSSKSSSTTTTTQSSSSSKSSSSSVNSNAGLTTVNGVVIALTTINGVVRISRISTISSVTSTITSSATMTAPATITDPAICTPDNCYNSMTMAEHTTYASSICSQLAQMTKTSTPYNDYLLDGCDKNPARISSACGCFYKRPSWMILPAQFNWPSSTSTTQSSSTTTKSMTTITSKSG